MLLKIVVDFLIKFLYNRKMKNTNILIKDFLKENKINLYIPSKTNKLNQFNDLFTLEYHSIIEQDMLRRYEQTMHQQREWERRFYGR